MGFILAILLAIAAAVLGTAQRRRPKRGARRRALLAKKIAAVTEELREVGEDVAGLRQKVRERAAGAHPSGLPRLVTPGNLAPRLSGSLGAAAANNPVLRRRDDRAVRRRPDRQPRNRQADDSRARRQGQAGFAGLDPVARPPRRRARPFWRRLRPCHPILAAGSPAARRPPARRRGSGPRLEGAGEGALFGEAERRCDLGDRLRLPEQALRGLIARFVGEP